jgi:hypothetical protein
MEDDHELKVGPKQGSERRRLWSVLRLLSEPPQHKYTMIPLPIILLQTQSVDAYSRWQLDHSPVSKAESFQRLRSLWLKGKPQYQGVQTSGNLVPNVINFCGIDTFYNDNFYHCMVLECIYFSSN